jgi:hypothetical protein
MRVPLACPTCMRADISAARIATYQEYNDTGLYDFVCSQGHTVSAIIQQQKFEILFEIGAYAILDGYYREAISSFVASLERTYEFFTKAAALANGSKPRLLDKTWKLVSKQSERQLGAFIISYLANFAEQPPLLNNDDVNFRNQVIHQGLIPTQVKTIEFGDRVLTIIRDVLFKTQNSFQKGIDEIVVGNMIANQTLAIKAGRQTVTVSNPTIVSLSISDPSHRSRSLAEALPLLRPKSSR